MVDESPRCDYFSLSERAQNKIFDYMDMAQIYRLGRASEKWKYHVHDKNIKVNRLRFGFFNERSWIEVCDPVKFTVQISHQTAEEHGPLNYEGRLCVEFPRNLKSSWSRFNRMISVFEELHFMFTLADVIIHLGPIPDFLDYIDSLIPMFNNKWGILAIGDPEASGDKITRAQLKHVLNKCYGGRLVTFNVEAGPAVDLPMKFRIVESKGPNWITESMLSNTTAKSVKITSPDGTGQTISLACVAGMIFEWYIGNMGNLEYLLCDFWIPTLDYAPDDILEPILYGIPPLDAPPLIAPPIELPNRTRYYRRADGKLAAIYHIRQELIIEFHFISWR